jgi:hypothetical protein
MRTRTIPSLPDPLAPELLATSSSELRVHEHLLSVAVTHRDEDAGMLGPGQEPALWWEITLPELLELASQSTDYTAVVNAWRGGEKVGQIIFRYAGDFDSFTMTFVASNDFVSLHVLSLSAPTWAVVISSADMTRVILIDSQTHEVLGGDAETDDLDVLIFPAQQVLTGLQAIRGDLEALVNGPQVAFGAATDRARCKNNRKAGWVAAIALSLTVALAVPTGGSSVAAFALFGAAGAAGGAAAAATDNAYGTCMDEAEEKERQDRAAREAAQEQQEEEDPQGGGE